MTCVTSSLSSFFCYNIFSDRFEVSHSFSKGVVSVSAPWVLHLAESVDHDSVAKVRAIVAVVVEPHESTVGLERRINLDLDQPVQFY